MFNDKEYTMTDELDPETQKILKQKFGLFFTANTQDLTRLVALNQIANQIAAYLGTLITAPDSDIDKCIEMLAFKLEHQFKAHTNNKEAYRTIPDILMKMAASTEIAFNDPGLSPCFEEQITANLPNNKTQNDPYRDMVNKELVNGLRANRHNN